MTMTRKFGTWTKITPGNSREILVYLFRHNSHLIADGRYDEGKDEYGQAHWPGAVSVILTLEEFNSIPPIRALMDAVEAGQMIKAREIASRLREGDLTIDMVTADDPRDETPAGG